VPMTLTFDKSFSFVSDMIVFALCDTSYDGHKNCQQFQKTFFVMIRFFSLAIHQNPVL
jgi:hypothetical protein